MGLVEPFYFRTGPLRKWHRAIAINRGQKLVIALCSTTGSYDRRNLNYEDIETRPYSGGICTKCDIDAPMRVVQRSTDVVKTVTTEKSKLPDLHIRKGTTVPTPVETYGELDDEQSPLGSGLSYDDAVGRKPRRILP